MQQFENSTTLSRDFDIEGEEKVMSNKPTKNVLELEIYIWWVVAQFKAK